MKTNMISLILALGLSVMMVLPMASTYASSNEEWRTAYTLGKFPNSELPKPDQIFQIHYRVIDGAIESFGVPHDGEIHGIEAKVSSDMEEGVLEIKYPRNYPYEPKVIIFVNGVEIIEEYTSATTDCFYDFSIPFEDRSEIVIAWPRPLTQTMSSDDIPDSCISETIVDASTLTPLLQRRAGVAAEDIICREEYELILDPNGRPFCATPTSAEILRERWNL